MTTEQAIKTLALMGMSYELIKYCTETNLLIQAATNLLTIK